MKLRKERMSPVVPMNAMSDVAFLLLIFIMLVALINYRREVHIEYSEAGNPKRTSAEKNLEIWIDEGGALYLDGIPAHLLAVTDSLNETMLNAPGTRIHIIADKNTPFKNINGIVEILQRQEYPLVSFVVKAEKER